MKEQKQRGNGTRPEALIKGEKKKIYNPIDMAIPADRNFTQNEAGTKLNF